MAAGQTGNSQVNAFNLSSSLSPKLIALVRVVDRRERGCARFCFVAQSIISCQMHSPLVPFFALNAAGGGEGIRMKESNRNSNSVIFSSELELSLSLNDCRSSLARQTKRLRNSLSMEIIWSHSKCNYVLQISQQVGSKPFT